MIRQRSIPSLRRSVQSTGVLLALFVSTIVFMNEPNLIAADLPDEAEYLVASGPFEHSDTVSLPPWLSAPIDLAVASDGRLFVADGSRFVIDVYGTDGQRHLQMGPPISLVSDGSQLIPVAIEFAADEDALDIVWQRFGASSSAPDGEYMDSWIERRAADGSILEPASAMPGNSGLVADLTIHITSRDRYVLKGGTVVRLIEGRSDITASLAITYPVGTPARIAATDERLIVVSGGVASLFKLDGTPLGELDLGGADAVAVGRTPSGGASVLLRAGGAAVLGTSTAVLGFDRFGDRDPATDQTTADIGLPPPTDLNWPYSLTYGGEHAVVSSTVSQRIHAVRRNGPLPLTLFAKEHDSLGEGFSPSLDERDEHLPVVISIGRDRSGGVLAVGCSSEKGASVSYGGCAELSAVAHRVTPDGAVRDGYLLGAGASDIAGSDDGGIVWASAGGVIRRMPIEPRVERLGAIWSDPEWSVTCNCRHGGRLTSTAGLIHVSEPETRTMLSIDATTGDTVRRRSATTTIGSWPADLASGTVGSLYSADTGRRIVERWVASGGDAPDATWTAGSGIGLGPQRIAGGRWRGLPIVASATSDGRIDLHEAGDGDLVLRWRPERPDGSRIALSEIAIDESERFFINDYRTSEIFIFQSVSGSWSPSTPTPGPSTTPPPRTCTVSGDKVAGPSRVILGDTAEVTINFRAECSPSETYVGADIVLAIMRNRSAVGDNTHEEWAFFEHWLNMVDYSRHRVGATMRDFDSRSIVIPLDSTPFEFLETYRSSSFRWSTNAWESVDDAILLLREKRRPDALPVIVLVDMTTWGLADSNDLLFIGNQARAEGILTYSIGMYRELPYLRWFSGSDVRTFFSPDPHETAGILAHLIREAGTSFAGDLTIDDTMSDDVFYEADTARPRAIESVGVSDLRWSRSVLPSDGMTMTFQVRPLRAGILPTNRLAVAHYDDVDGARRELVFPIPEIEVIAPTPSRTPTTVWTPEPTPTLAPTQPPGILPVYLPVAFSNVDVIRQLAAQ